MCYTEGDHVTCADLKVGRTALIPCNCPCHDNQRPRPLQLGCEEDITDDVGNWLGECGVSPIKIILERSYCKEHGAKRELWFNGL